MYLRRSLVATTVLPLLALAACQGEPEPEPTPITAEPTATDTPTSQATEEPAGEYEEGSPEAFIVEWQAAADEFQRTGDPAEFEKLNKDCRECENFIARVREIYSSGGRIDFDGTEVGEIRAVKSGSREFSVDIHSSEQRVFDGSGGAPRVYEEFDATVLLVLVGSGSGWRVASQNLGSS